jgi:hypothetical protein
MDRQSMLAKIVAIIYPNAMVRTVVWDDEEHHADVSLARVLIELGFDCTYMLWDIVKITSMKWPTINWRYTICKRQLLTDSGEEAMLDDQSDETIRDILSFLSE